MKSLPFPLPKDSSCHILTQRLQLTPMLPKHASDMFLLLQDTKLYKFIGGNPPENEKALYKTYEFRQKRHSPDRQELWLNWLVQRRDNASALGYLQASIDKTNTSIAWVIGTEYQGLGYASEAAKALVLWLNALGAPPIIACVYPEHIASQGVAKAAGLKLTDRIVDGEQVWAQGKPEVLKS